MPFKSSVWMIRQWEKTDNLTGCSKTRKKKKGLFATVEETKKHAV